MRFGLGLIAVTWFALFCLDTPKGHAYFVDTWEDGDAEDGNPVTWIPHPIFQSGTREVVNGDYVLTPDRYEEMDSEVEGLIFSDVSIRTQFRSMGHNWMGVYARDTPGPNGQSVWGGMDPFGRLYFGRTGPLVGNDTLGDLATGWNPLAQDVLMQLDIFGTQLSLTAWLDGMVKPAGPQLSIDISGIAPDLTDGKVGLWMAPVEPTPLEPVYFRWYVAGPAAGDFHTDGVLGCEDINALVAAIVAGTNDPFFDMSGDGSVDRFDLDAWLATAGAANLPSGNSYLSGDANLDGVVDGLDFIEWNNNKFTSIAAWCSGDFNADGIVDGQDFIEWNNNKFQSADRVLAVPEPGFVASVVAVLLVLGSVRRNWL